MPTRIIHQPAGRLAQHVEVIVLNEGFTFPHEREVFLPDGGVDLVIDLGRTPKKLFHDEAGTEHISFRHGWLSGMRRERFIIESGNGSPMLVLRFRAGGARCFTGLPLNELNDRVVALEDLWGPAFHRLRDKLGEHWEQSGASGFMDRVEHELLALLNPTDAHPLTGAALHMLASRAGQPRIDDLASQLGCSQKHLNALFQRDVGLSPKAYARVMRFQSVVQRIERDAAPDWMQVAVDHGYYDHSHLVNDFRATAGMSPERYLRAKGPYLNWIPLVAQV